MRSASVKATPAQVRRHNRALVLRAIYTGLADNRAELAEATGLTKPTVSDLVAELLDEGYLLEGELGQSGTSGGKRPRLLEFLPDARQVIGVAVNGTRIDGTLMNLNGDIIAEHASELDAGELLTADSLCAVINGLRAQMNAPLLAIGLGLPGATRHAHHALALALGEQFAVAVHAESTMALVALAQLAFSQPDDADSLATVVIGAGVGVGIAYAGDSGKPLGGDIGHVFADGAALDALLGWQAVSARAHALGTAHESPLLCAPDFTYIHARCAAANGDPAAHRLSDELSALVALVFGWAIALMQPAHLSLTGALANLGEPFLDRVIAQTRTRILAELVDATQFSIDDTPNLAALGAAAFALRRELGVV